MANSKTLPPSAPVLNCKTRPIAFTPPFTQRGAIAQLQQNRGTFVCWRPSAIFTVGNRRASNLQMVDKSPQQSDASSLPQSLRNEHAIVVGGGPCGSFAAMLLDQRGIRTTLIESDADFLDVNLSKSYTLGIFGRGLIAAKAIPELIKYITPFSVPSNMSAFAQVHADGSIRQPSRTKRERGMLLFMRFRLLHVLKSFVRERTGVRAIYGVRVRDIDFHDDGSITLHAETQDGVVEQLNSRLVLACDGKNSIVLKHLRAAHDNRDPSQAAVHSARGLPEYSARNSAVGTRLKTVLMDERVLDTLDVVSDPDNRAIVQLKGLAKGRPANQVFQLSLWPMLQRDKDVCGGILAISSRGPDHALWKLKTVEEAFQMFETNFPQIDVRAYISEKEMQKFVEARPVSFPEIARPLSLAATVGDDARGGVVLLGDAAHCFPPTIGMGVNSGFEDAVELMRVIDGADDTAQIGELVTRYDWDRNEDTWGLMKLAQYALPYAMGDDRLRVKLSYLRFPIKMKLASWFPNVFYPPCVGMLESDLPFSEIWRRGHSSTIRIVAALSSIVGIPVMAYLVHLIMGGSKS